MNVRDALIRMSASCLFCLLAGGPVTEGQIASTTRRPASNSPATIRIWGVGPAGGTASPLLPVLGKLEDDYRIAHPEVSFVHHLSGNDSALGGLYVGAADLALMDREPSYIELDGYQQVVAGAKPFEIALMRGGTRRGGHSSPLVVIVNRGNPLRTLSISQLEAIYRADPSSPKQRARTWGDLGLTGEWANQPLQLYGFGIESSEARTLSNAVMDGSRRWACAYRELGDTSTKRAAERVEGAVAGNPYSLGITTFDAVTAHTKVVAIQRSVGMPKLPTPETLASGEYVLGRTVLVLARTQKDGLVDSRVRSFLAYLVSSRAQKIIAADGAYVPLMEELLAKERQRLGSTPVSVTSADVRRGENGLPAGQPPLAWPELAHLKPYVPGVRVSGVIRNFGNNYIPGLMKSWEEGFRRQQPGVRFETNLPGSEAAMAGLYGGLADLAFIGRESYSSEEHAFGETLGHPPLAIEISSGSFQTPHKTFALMVFVHKDNPLAKLTLPELARLYGCRDGADGRGITEWGQLGLKGEWEHRPIHVYGYSLNTGMARYFQRAVLKGSDRWTEDLMDFDNGHGADGQVINAGVYVLEALAKDPAGIAYANFLYAGPNVKPLALARDTGSESWKPTPDSAFRRDYPLTRFTTVFLDRKPGRPVDPRLKEFLLYILSRDGMEAVVEDGAYLPLNAKQIEIERKKLE